MSKTVSIDGNKVNIFNAIIWASENFGKDNIKVENSFPSWFWNFTFLTENQATIFALKWIR